MKSKTLFIIIILGLLISCDEYEILKEIPRDFLSIENAYVTDSDFELAINNLHSQARGHLSIPNSLVKDYYTVATTDIVYRTTSPTDLLNSPNIGLVPSNERIAIPWKELYRIIYDANVIIDRIDGPNTVFKDETKRDLLKAEASFFRAFAYRGLACIYGGVPLVINEIKEPKRDFVRATREETWQQCAEDLEFSIPRLPDADNVAAPGRICNAAAQHLLAEIYVSLKEWDKAISATNAVINSGKFELMKERFGSLADQPGDVYWDLFRVDNQNRTSGNLEGIWVVQFEDIRNSPGGSTGDGNRLERRMIPRYSGLKGPDGKGLVIGSTTHNCGFGQGFNQPTKYVENDIWLSDWDNDIRNSEFNIRRDIIADNPQSTYYGQKIIENNLISPNQYFRIWYPMFTKCSTPGQHPDEAIANKETGLMAGGPLAGKTFRDIYAIRLAETYLLRAEAYLGKGDNISAASDINVVRSRANATPVNPVDVTLDYILDERVRELLYEEQRFMTLGRLGLCYERKKKYNEYCGDQISPHHNLWPIPYSEIERNTGAVLEQNPGYQ